jgi:hypothetical protein
MGVLPWQIPLTRRRATILSCLSARNWANSTNLGPAQTAKHLRDKGQDDGEKEKKGQGVQDQRPEDVRVIDRFNRARIAGLPNFTEQLGIELEIQRNLEPPLAVETAHRKYANPATGYCVCPP